MKYNRDEIYEKLKGTIQGLRQSINMLLASGNYYLKKQSRLSDVEYAQQLNGIVDMLHEIVIDNVVILGMIEKYPRIKKAFKEIRKELSDKLLAEIRELTKPKSKIIVPGMQVVGAPKIVKP